MMKIRIAAAILPALLLQTLTADAGLWGRGKIPAAWAGKDMAMDSNTSGWTSSEVYEESGVSFKALNDSEYLYISVSAHEAGARQILSGTIRQSVSIWFLDGKKRAWGVRLPFGEPGGVPGAYPGAPDILEPELIVSSGVVISTGVLPGDVKFDGDILSRVPAYKLKVPLASLKPAGGRVPLDFVTAYASPEQENETKEKFAEAAKKFPMNGQHGDPSGIMPQSNTSPGMTPAGGMMSGGGGRTHGMHGGMSGGRRGGPRGGAHQPSEPPEPIDMQLAVVLAAKP